MERLNAVRTPAPLGSAMEESSVYILAGSLVGFLIERYELAKFRALYDTETGDYEARGVRRKMKQDLTRT